MEITLSLVMTECNFDSPIEMQIAMVGLFPMFERQRFIHLDESQVCRGVKNGVQVFGNVCCWLVICRAKTTHKHVQGE